MKKIFLFAAAAFFAACSSDDLAVKEQPQVQTEPGAVAFDAYAGRSVTRSGLSGSDLTNTTIQGNDAAFGGFGAFGYYTDNRDYDQTAMPNFMYNQKVMYSVGAWTYEPVKYWPNEYGDKAVSDDNDKVSFFAYAPYAQVDPTTGKTTLRTGYNESDYTTAKTTWDGLVEDYEEALADEQKKYVAWKNKATELGIAVSSTPASSDPGYTEYSAWNTAKTTTSTAWSAMDGGKTAWVDAQKAYYSAGGGEFGITGLTRNSAAGDPVVKWVGSFRYPEAVDLCWGICQEPNWPLVNGGALDFATKQGLPWLNIERPSQIDQRLKFQFKHALAKLQINVDEFNDDIKLNGDVDNNTRIWIRSVKFTGFSMKGALNLNNETKDKPYWMNYNGIGDLDHEADITVYDGMKDGKEGVQGATASNEKQTGLNEKFIETAAAYGPGEWFDVPKGVDATASPLFADGGVFYVIPSDDELTIEIVYDVETIDQRLGTLLSDGKTHGSAIENHIFKTVNFNGAGSKLEAGKAYIVNLHLGMNSVKLDANVANWEDVAPAEVDLPANVQFFAVANPAADATATIPYYATSYLVGLSGLNGGEAVNVAEGKNSWNDATGSQSALTPAWLDDTSLGGGVWNGTKLNANTSGYIVQTLTTTPNTTTVNRTQVVTWTGNTSSKAITITFTQQAAPLALAAPSPKTAAAGNGDADKPEYEYQLTRSGADYGFFCTKYQSTPSNFANLNKSANGDPETGDNGIKVWRNGTKLTLVDIFTEVASKYTQFNEFKFTDGGLLTVNENFKKGDVIKVTLKTGDAPAETITWTVE